MASIANALGHVSPMLRQDGFTMLTQEKMVLIPQNQDGGYA